MTLVIAPPNNYNRQIYFYFSQAPSYAAAVVAAAYFYAFKYEFISPTLVSFRISTPSTSFPLSLHSAIRFALVSSTRLGCSTKKKSRVKSQKSKSNGRRGKGTTQRIKGEKLTPPKNKYAGLFNYSSIYSFHFPRRCYNPLDRISRLLTITLPSPLHCPSPADYQQVIIHEPPPGFPQN